MITPVAAAVGLAVGLIVGGLSVACWFLYRSVLKLLEALQRTSVRMSHARWLIYRDWEEADVILGIAERDVARVLHQDREDVVPRIRMDPPSSDLVERIIAAHRAHYPRQTRE